MKLKRLALLTIASISLVGCKNKSKSQSAEEDLSADFSVEYELCDTMETLEDKSVYHRTCEYSDKYFKYTASTYKRPLMLLSYAATNSAVETTTGGDFFTKIGFSTIYTSPEYETIGTKESVRYFIAKKKIDDFTVFAVSFKSHRYGSEWASNFDLGESGNHVGFMTAATKVYNNLLTYISNENNYKLWFSGYSRGGALSNVLSHLVMSNTSLGINETNLYTYTFASTRALTKDNAKPYKNVFNLYNSADLLSNFAPKDYGLYRCGIDIDIFDEHIDNYLSDFSPELVLEQFSPSKGFYQNDKEFTVYFLNQLLKEDTSTYKPDKYPYDLCTREHYCRLEGDVSYLLTLVLAMPEYLTIFNEEFAGADKSELISYFSDNGQKLYTKAKEIFDKYDVNYEDEALLQSCQVTVLLAKRYMNLILVAASNSNASRMITMHMTEMIYILIRRVDYHG